MEADLKIVTGLVESHFMAGASGGRKGICPGIVGKETLSIFHGAKLLNSSMAADLILEGNPLHDEALEIALMAGCASRAFALAFTIISLKEMRTSEYSLISFLASTALPILTSMVR